MFNANNPRHKLTPERLKEAREYYEDKGWKILWISRFFNVDARAVRFHAGTNGWIRRAGIAKYMPEPIAEIYRERRKERYLKRSKGTYTYIQMAAQAQKGKDCEHHRWVKRCSTCGEILGSDATDHKH